MNSGFGTGADWDGQYDGMSEGWRLFLENLRLHLTHFPGQRARAIISVGSAPGPNAAAFDALCRSLGVPVDLAPGDAFATAMTGATGAPELRGAVQVVQRRPKISAYFLTLDAPAPGTGFVAAEGDGEAVSVCLYLYLYGPAAAEVEGPWTAFLAERFPLPQRAPAR